MTVEELQEQYRLEVEKSSTLKKNWARSKKSTQRCKVIKLYFTSAFKILNPDKRMPFSQKNNRVHFLLESRIENLIESFQNALYRQQNNSPTQIIYSPEEMKLFTDTHSPGLFQMMLECISGKKN